MVESDPNIMRFTTMTHHRTKTWLVEVNTDLIKRNLSLAEQWFIDLFNQMNQILSVDYPGNIWFKTDNQKYMYYDQKNNKLWTYYSRIWQLLQLKFKMTNKQIRELITNVVEQNTSLNGFTINFCLTVDEQSGNFLDKEINIF